MYDQVVDFAGTYEELEAKVDTINSNKETLACTGWGGGLGPGTRKEPQVPLPWSEERFLEYDTLWLEYEDGVPIRLTFNYFFSDPRQLTKFEKKDKAQFGNCRIELFHSRTDLPVNALEFFVSHSLGSPTALLPLSNQPEVSVISDKAESGFFSRSSSIGMNAEIDSVS